MSEITLKLKIPKEILNEVDLKRITKKIEEEIMIEYSLKKLYGKFKGSNLEKLFKEVEEEWGLV